VKQDIGVCGLTGVEIWSRALSTKSVVMAVLTRQPKSAGRDADDLNPSGTIVRTILPQRTPVSPTPEAPISNPRFTPLRWTLRPAAADDSSAGLEYFSRSPV
jgi:hypothetical protein